MGGEGDGVVADGEFGGVEDEEAGGDGDVDRDLYGSGELAGGEIGDEGEVVALGGGEFGEAGLTLELIDALIARHCFFLPPCLG